MEACIVVLVAGIEKLVLNQVISPIGLVLVVVQLGALTGVVGLNLLLYLVL